MRHLARCLAAICCVGAFALAPSVQADETDIKRALDELLAFYAPQPDAGLSITTAAPARIEGRGSVYNIVLPGLVVHFSRWSLSVGDLPLLVREQGAGGISFLAELPERMTVADEIGQPAGSVRLSERSLRGVFDPQLFAFINFEAKAERPIVALRQGDPIGAAALAFTHAAGPLSPTRWVTHTSLAVTGLNLETAGPGKLSVAHAEYVHRLDEIDLARYGAFARATGADPLAFLSRYGRPETAPETLANLLDGVGLGRMESEWTLRSLHIGDSVGSQVTISELAGRLALSGLSDGRAALTARASAADLALTFGRGTQFAPSPVYRRFIPRAFSLEFQLANIPLAEVLRLLPEALPGGPEGITRFAPQIERLREVLRTSGITLELKPSRIDAPALQLSLNGAAATDPATQWGGRAALVIEASGLQQAATALRQQTNDPEAIAAAAALLVLQGIGKPVDAAGRAQGKLRYDLSFDGDGAFYVNGLDVGLLASLIAPQSGGGGRGDGRQRRQGR